MRRFNDNAGRSWAVQINLQAIERVRDLTQVVLLERMTRTATPARSAATFG